MILQPDHRYSAFFKWTDTENFKSISFVYLEISEGIWKTSRQEVFRGCLYGGELARRWAGSSRSDLTFFKKII